MATAGGSGVSGAAAGTTNLSADQLRGYLLAWGIPAPRVELRSKRLAEVGVTLKGLAELAVLPLDVWLPFLIGKGEEANEGDKFDALLIMAGATKATAAAAAAGVVSLPCGFASQRNSSISLWSQLGLVPHMCKALARVN